MSDYKLRMPREVLSKTFPEMELADNPNPRLHVEQGEGAALIFDCLDGPAIVGLTKKQADEVANYLIWDVQRTGWDE